MRIVKLAAVAAGALVLVAAQTALAVGGSDEDPSNQINKATYGCQQAILKGAAKFRKTIEKDFTKCMLGALKCDQKATDAEADSCRGKLLVPGTGFCAIGRIDSSTPGSTSPKFYGPTSTALAIGNAATKAEKALAKWADSVQEKCFETDGVDLSDSGTGLNVARPSEFFNPASAVEVIDDLNRLLDGTACGFLKEFKRGFPNTDSLLLKLEAHPDGANLAASYSFLVSTFNSFCARSRTS
jgi:hypothetical protein